MKNLNLILVVLLGFVIVSCEKDNADKTKMNSINLSVDNNSLVVGESLKVKHEVLPAQVSDSTISWSSSDTSIATVSNGLVTGVNAGTAIISAKANDGSNVSASISLQVIEALKNETISAKWNVSNSNEYESFEFNKSGNYIVAKKATLKSSNDQTVLFGTYNIIDNTTISLSGFGTLTISEINKNSISFSIKLANNPNTEIVINGSKQEEMESSTNTELLCRTWEMVTMNDNSVVGTDMELTVLFSAAGTYFISVANPNDENDGGLAQWKWKNEAETQFFYSWDDVPNWEKENSVEVPELTSSTLKIIEGGDTFMLQPALNTKPFSIKTSKSNNKQLKSGFFKK